MIREYLSNFNFCPMISWLSVIKLQLNNMTELINVLSRFFINEMAAIESFFEA